MKYCPNCQKDFDDEFIFCHYCGEKLQDKNPKLFCPYCGNKIDADDGYCPHCGKDLIGIHESNSRLQGEEELRLGIELDSEKNYVEAYKHFENAIKLGYSEAIIWYLTSVEFNEDEANVEEIVDIAEKAYNNQLKFKETYKKCNHFADILDYHYISDKVGHTLSFKWRKLAADNGDAVAQHNLGINYSTGEGTEINIDKAIEYSLKAADQGVLTANLGNYYAKKKDYQTALKWYKKAAEPNGYSLWCKIGEMYQNGIGTEKDLEQAIAWYKRALKSPTYISACYNLGLLCENGEGTKQNYRKAMMYYYEVADGNSAISNIAKFKLGVMYSEGKGAIKDLNIAEAYLREAVDKGVADAQSVLNSVISIKNNNHSALKQRQEYYKNLAEQGNARAQCQLGTIYLNGEGCQKDYNQALYWYNQAAGQGDSESLCQLGKMFKNGYGVEKDISKAKGYFQYAANQGFADAQYNLGLLLHEQQAIRSVVLMNNKDILYLFENAANQGHIDAQCFLGSEYLFGIGTGSLKVKYPKKAIFWYQKAIEQGSLKAQYELGLLYYNGEHVNKDKQKGYNLILKSALAGFVPAQKFLAGRVQGDLINNDLENEETFMESYVWCRKLVEEGDSFAQCVLGQMYENGKPVCRNYKKAFKWYTKASEAGNSYADYLLGQLYDNGLGVEKDDQKAEELYRKAYDNCCLYAEFALKRKEEERKKKEEERKREEIELKKSQCETVLLSSLTPQIIKLALDVALDDNNWRQCGFKEGNPKRGKLFKVFIKREQLAKESFLLRQFIAMPLGIFVRNLYFATEFNYENYIQYLVDILVSIEGMEELIKTQYTSATSILNTSITNYTVAKDTYAQFVESASIYPEEIKIGAKPLCDRLNKLIAQNVKNINDNYYIEDDITSQ